MHARNRWMVLAVLCSSLFLIVVDMTVLYTALPRLTHDLRASASEKLWIVNAYALTMSGLLLGMGALGDRLGHKKLFVAGLGVFGIASLAAAFSPAPDLLIAARVLLAVGAAMMMPATLSIIRQIFTDERERAVAIGIWASVASGGAAFGPVIGGLLLEFFWWGSVFLINLPIVIVALALAVPLIPARPGNPDRPFDLTGSVQIMIGLVAIAYAVKEMGTRAPSLPAILVAGVVGLIAVTIFVRRQRRSTAPMIDFALFRNRLFMSAVVTAIIASAALISLELVFSQRLQLVERMSPLQAGLFILPIPLAAFVSGPLAGWAMPVWGTTRILWMSMLLAAAGVGGILFAFEAGGVALVAAFVTMGFGIGAAMTAASHAIMSNAPVERAGMAASIEEVSFEFGGAVGIAILGSLMSAIYTLTMAVPGGIALPANVRDSLDEALLAAESLPADTARRLIDAANAAFASAFTTVTGVAAVLLAVTAIAMAVAQRRSGTA